MSPDIFSSNAEKSGDRKNTGQDKAQIHEAEFPFLCKYFEFKHIPAHELFM